MNECAAPHCCLPGSADGITKIILNGSMQDTSKALVKGKGADVDEVALETLDADGLVVVQLINDSTNACFESTFTAPDFITFDDPERFKATAQ